MPLQGALPKLSPSTTSYGLYVDNICWCHKEGGCWWKGLKASADMLGRESCDRNGSHPEASRTCRTSGILLRQSSTLSDVSGCVRSSAGGPDAPFLLSCRSNFCSCTVTICATGREYEWLDVCATVRLTMHVKPLRSISTAFWKRCWAEKQRSGTAAAHVLSMQVGDCLRTRPDGWHFRQPVSFC